MGYLEQGSLVLSTDEPRDGRFPPRKAQRLLVRCVVGNIEGRFSVAAWYLPFQACRRSVPEGLESPPDQHHVHFDVRAHLSARVQYSGVDICISSCLGDVLCGTCTGIVGESYSCNNTTASERMNRLAT